jgi:murein DD-endopeptidase MepM/ murein hydrolase activator NlpD
MTPSGAHTPAPDAASRSPTPSLLDELTNPRGPEPLRKAVVPAAPQNWALPFLGWVIALGAVAYAVILWQARPVPPAAGVVVTVTPRPTLTPIPTSERPVISTLPAVRQANGVTGIARKPNLRTIIPTRPRTETIIYEVDFGDAIFSIAERFNITPETLLWANYELLNDNPDFLEVGMALNVPPVDGVYYQWQEGDTLESVAAEFEAEMDAILEFTGNNLDLANPVIEAGQFVMLPGGHREFRTWLIPVFDRGNAGVLGVALGAGSCTGTYTGPVGSGAFIWPTANHTLSGNDFWSGHLGIDIGLVTGDPVWAADAGVVVFSGWANGGYGNTIMIDHGNGYQTLYAHLNSVSRPCGAGVSAGTVVGAGGSTGNSTGAHLHFEVRSGGGFINPWYVLPPP